MKKDENIPTGWQIGRLSYLIKSMDAGVSVNSEGRKAEKGEYGILKTSAVTSGILDADENKVIVPSEITRAKISPFRDCIIMSRMNTPALVGASAYVPKTIDDVFLPDRLWMLTAKKKCVNMRWLSFVLGSQKYRSKLSSFATGTSNSMKNITKGDVKSLQILFPPLPEQKAIADMLSLWDEAIEKIERLIELKEVQLQGNIAAYLNNPNHPRGRVGAVVAEVTVRNTRVTVNRVLSVTNSKGFVLPENYFKKSVASQDLRNYKIVRKGQYAYNPSRINVGSIARLDEWEDGVLSPMYIIFSLDQAKINSDFFQFWLMSHSAKARIRMSAQGSVRESVNFKDFSNLKLPLPTYNIQSSIATFLSCCSDEIECLRKTREKLAVQKCGLMQKLLTGKWRVPVTEAVSCL